jgi:hypothetical protein
MIEADLDRLLHNWTMWKSGAGRGGMGYAASSYDLEGRGSRAGVTMPVIDGEAMLIDGLVNALVFEERQALHARYLRQVLLATPAEHAGIDARALLIPPSFTDEQIAKRLQCGARTFERRLGKARRQLWDCYCVHRHHVGRGS